MFDFGFWEIMVVMVVALLVVGPERLPGLASKVGGWVGKAKRFASSVKSDIRREFHAEEMRQMLDKQQGEIHELKGMLNDAQSDLRSELDDTTHLVKAIENQIEEVDDSDAVSAPEKDTAEHHASRSDDTKPSNGK